MPPAKTRWLPALLPLLAFLVMLPSLLRVDSCGHDTSFHVLSWLEAARQFAHGTIYPAWAVSPAFNAGEPRFIFYPPLSWFEGAALISIVPAAIVTKLYVWIALSLAGLSLFFVARRFSAPTAAFLAASLYIANPYMLFTAFERSAFAELLAAAWIPWIFAAALREKPRAVDIAWPLALLWLTNAPAGVMASYTLLVLGLVRLITAWHRKESVTPILSSFIGGSALGLAMTAVYLIPAAYERRFVQITMAVVPGLSVPQNFLFAHTTDSAHDLVNHQVSWIAIGLLVTAALALLATFQRASSATLATASVASGSVVSSRQNNDGRSPLSANGAPYTSVGQRPTNCPREEIRALKARPIDVTPAISATCLALIVLTIGVLLFHPSQWIWLHLPELSFLQFPWRWLMVLAAAAALLIAVALRHLKPTTLGVAAAAIAVIGMSFLASRDFIFACDRNESPAAIAELFRKSHGAPATDEYTPGIADNDVIRFDSPAYWLSTDPQAFAPNTIPNPNATQPDVDFGTPPPSETVSQPAPSHLDIDIPSAWPKAEYMILNLRAYPNWDVADSGESSMSLERPAWTPRDDGLIAIPMASGHHNITITWQTGRDRELGALVSLFALALFASLLRRSRKIVQ